MRPPTPSRRQFLSASLAASAGLAGCSIPGPEESTRSIRSVEAPPDTPLVVDNSNGPVRVTDGGTDTISLEIEKRTNFGRDRLDDVTVEAGVSDGRILVETVGDLPVGVSVAVDLTFRLPEGVPVERVDTENGNVTVEDVPGDAELESTNGRIRADNVDGFLTLRSVNGSVDAADIGGLDGATSVNGTVDVEVPAIRGDTTARTTNGDVRLAVPEDLDAEIDLRTTNGDVLSSGLDLSLTTDRDTRLQGTLGEGGDTLSGETTNGDVRLRAL